MDDWEAGEEVEIALDPSTPALEQAEALFKKARKLRRTSENVEPLLQQGEEDLEYLQEVESQVEALQPGDQGDLQALREIEVLLSPSEAPFIRVCSWATPPSGVPPQNALRWRTLQEQFCYSKQSALQRVNLLSKKKPL